MGKCMHFLASFTMHSYLTRCIHEYFQTSIAIGPRILSRIDFHRVQLFSYISKYTYNVIFDLGIFFADHSTDLVPVTTKPN